MLLPDNVILIADDYAMNQVVSDHIRSLLSLGKIDGTSCMANAEGWPEAAAALKALHAQRPDFQVGLHFCLTEEQMPSLSNEYTQAPLNKILVDSHLRKINKRVIEEEFRAQLAAFTEHFSRLPDFIDGHQHVHSFPVVRDAIIDALKDSGFDGWIRQCNGTLMNTLSRPFRFKALTLSLIGIGFKKQLQRNGYHSNTDFSGIYDFSETAEYSVLLKKWLDVASRYPKDTLIMCHPGDNAGNESLPHDPIAPARTNEYKTLLNLTRNK